MPSMKGSMAPSIVYRDAVQGKTFLPGQIFVFGGFALRANSLGRLEQIDSYTPGRQVRFGSLNFTADIRGDLIFDGFASIPLWDTRNPSSLPEGMPNTHFSGLSLKFTWRKLSKVSSKS